MFLARAVLALPCTAHTVGMSTRFDENKHPRRSDGKFTHKTYTEADDVEISDMSNTGDRVTETKRALEEHGHQYYALQRPGEGRMVYAENMEGVHQARMNYLHALIDDRVATGSVETIQSDMFFRRHQRDSITRMTRYTDTDYANSVFNPDAEKARREADRAEKHLQKTRNANVSSQAEVEAAEDRFARAQFSRAVFGDEEGAWEAVARNGWKINYPAFQSRVYYRREALEMARLSGVGKDTEKITTTEARKALKDMGGARVHTLLGERFVERYLEVEQVDRDCVHVFDASTFTAEEIRPPEKAQYYRDSNGSIVMTDDSGMPQYVFGRDT